MQFFSAILLEHPSLAQFDDAQVGTQSTSDTSFVNQIQLVTDHHSSKLQVSFVQLMNDRWKAFHSLVLLSTDERFWPGDPSVSRWIVTVNIEAADAVVYVPRRPDFGCQMLHRTAKGIPFPSIFLIQLLIYFRYLRNLKIWLSLVVTVFVTPESNNAHQEAIHQCWH